ncbi:uncharacterized protein [Drosophila pseudoobscura]|uniref:Uncharacterized protein n=1 Tax=Drosophila pseudoobscura pseudoobscura TaxID=46245 RepID=A0A6I8URM4_DROPS|nr:uncharacterized protein LOC4803024 [Drosophila pseudoobscura]
MSLSVAVVAASIWLIVCTFSLVQANVRFHFTLDFHVKQPANGQDETINKTILVENNQISVIDNEPTTKSPISQWTDHEQYNEATVQKVVEARRAVQQLNVELAPLVGRSNDLAIRLKQSLRYVNEVDATLENLSNFGQLVELLRKFVILVDALREPANYGGIRSLEYVLLKLALEKYELNSKRQEINEYLQRAETAWTSYKSTQVVLLENSNTT